MQYLEFEQPIEQLNNKLIKAKELASKKNMNTSKKIIDIENQIQEAKKNIYNNLTAWQKVQLSRHPNRPYCLDYILSLTNGDFVELHGDRNV
ncbi:MAG: acetyl-CoA carboxylase carboxyl transferase subunit alpha, partial [Flavobacteriales bacterium]|nr:acetyl-CoA carboxylase carboxyl transferase subunit alpha [Flavobacteriales bacterium]